MPSSSVFFIQKIRALSKHNVLDLNHIHTALVITVSQNWKHFQNSLTSQKYLHFLFMYWRQKTAANWSTCSMSLLSFSSQWYCNRIPFDAKMISRPKCMLVTSISMFVQDIILRQTMYYDVSIRSYSVLLSCKCKKMSLSWYTRCTLNIERCASTMLAKN